MARKINIIAEGWKDFKKQKIAKEVPEEYLRMMRIAFYAGAYHSFTGVGIAVGQRESHLTMGIMVEEVKTEVETFMRQYPGGRSSKAKFTVKG